MITVSAVEFEALLAKAEVLFQEAVYAGYLAMKSGLGIDNVVCTIKPIYCALEALRGYKTGEFEPAEFYNVLDADEVSKIFNLING
ncbi:hypothetical protein KO02_12190 [Sphingobacterium sp. ML3W]|uniref:hypothetical protein n=1 Tax=Sphingobacterium sp. ML3W TaxID=1538644 RepID=UPI0004F5EC19|nr:hypothetical protein [Sphingobacterium sp. ML3W]AIM37366.1 hypothetical protein KO02_12190 [Sphingobacterium sp. ML3W]